MPNVARLYSELGDVYARAAEGRRQFWGQAIAGITGIPSQIIAAKQAQQHEQRKAAYDDAHLALERAQVALEQGKVERADQEYKLSQQLNGYENAITTAAMASGKWSDDAALQHARDLNDPRAVPIAHKLNQQNQPKLTEHDPEKALRDQTGNIVVPAQAKPLTYGTPQPAMVNGKRQMVRTASDGSLVDLQGRKVEGATVTPDEPPMSEYQRQELNIQRARLAKEGPPDQVWVTRNGVLTPIRKGSAQPGDTPYSATAGRPSTGEEKKTLAFYNRAREAVETLTSGEANSLERRIAHQSTAGQFQQKYAPNIVQTPDQQLYTQAQRAFTEARLRKESGAAIPESEFENDRKTYFAQPGDEDATIEQKRKSRETVLNGLKFGAGKAYEEYYGEANNSPEKKVTVLKIEKVSDR